MNLKWQDNLLLKCISYKGDELTCRDLNGFSSVDWDKLIGAAEKHNVAPLLYEALKICSRVISVPESVVKDLRNKYLICSARNIRLFHRLSELLSRLNKERIPVLVLKGAHLVPVVYQREGLRSMSDVDLLFKKDDLARGQQFLKDNGYYDYNSPLPVDIHWNIELAYRSLPIDIEGVWARAEYEEISGVEALVLSPEDLLLHLCVHFSYHHLFELAGLRVLCDVKKTIGHFQDRMSWPSIVKRAREWQAGNALSITLDLAKDMVGAEVPEWVLQELEPDDLEQEMKDWAIEQIFGESPKELSLSPLFWKFWLEGSLGSRIRALCRVLFPPKEYILQKYPASDRSTHYCLYYLKRLKENYRRYGRAARRILLNRGDMNVLREKEKEKESARRWLSS